MFPGLIHVIPFAAREVKRSVRVLQAIMVIFDAAHIV